MTMEETLVPEPVAAKGRVDLHRLRRAMGRANLDPGPGGGFLQRVGELLEERLEGIRLQPRRILELGGRDPFLARRLEARFPGAKVSRLTLSEQGAAAGAVVALSTALPFPRERFDLVISSMALHWSGDLRRALLECRRVLNHDGLLLLALPGSAMLMELRQALEQWDRHQGVAYARTPPLPELRDLGDTLAACGFAVPVADRERMSAPFPSLRALLLALRRMGAGNPMQPRSPALMGKGVIPSWARSMGVADADSPFQATLEVLFGHGWKPPAPGKNK